MVITLFTKEDFQSLEDKINDLVASMKAQEDEVLGKVLTTKELSERLKVSSKTINNWRENRLIEFCKVNNIILYTERAVIEFLTTHSIKRRNSFANRLKSNQNG